jgi:hypothetical protein
MRRLAGAIALFAAFAGLTPFVGTLLAMNPTVLAALAVEPAAAVALVAGSAHDQFERRLLIPRVYEATMRLSLVAVLLALLAGGSLLGVAGALRALPLAAGIRVVVEDLRIDRPGEQPGEVTEQTRHNEAEAAFAQRASGSSAVEAATIATELAAQLQDATAPADLPAAARGDRPATPPPAASAGNADAGSAAGCLRSG